MIPLLALLAATLAGPDPVPALEAVKTCDRQAMSGLVKAEPRRRADFAATAYAEQQSIARDRAALLARQTVESSAAGKASLDLALTQLEARQKQLEDARAVERGWRDLYDELRADYLANCAGGKGSLGGTP